MKDANGNVVRGRTRWRRFLILLGPAFGVVAVMMFLVANGVLAVSFAISGIPFKLSASNLSGNGFVQYAFPDPVNNANAALLIPGASNQQGTTTFTKAGQVYVADTVTALHDATILDLHQTVCLPVSLPAFTSLIPDTNLLVTIDAGPHATTAGASASHLLVEAPSLTASSATFTNIAIGADLHQALVTNFGSDPGGTGFAGPFPTGLFAQAADSVSISTLKQVAIGTQAGSFTLPGLVLSAGFVGGCP